MKQITLKDIVDIYENDFVSNSAKWSELVLAPSPQLSEQSKFSFYTSMFSSVSPPKTRNTIRTMYRMAMSRIKQLNRENKALEKILL